MRLRGETGLGQFSTPLTTISEWNFYEFHFVLNSPPGFDFKVRSSFSSQRRIVLRRLARVSPRAWMMPEAECPLTWLSDIVLETEE